MEPENTFDIAKIVADAAARLPVLQEELEAILARVNPLELLAQLCVAFQTHPEDEFPDVDEVAKWQTYIELVAWTVLSRPAPELDDELLIDNAILGPLEDTLDSYFVNKATSLSGLSSEEPRANAEHELKFRLQLHTLNVRGEGSPQEVERLATAIYGPHRDWFLKNLGFTIEDAFRYTRAMLELMADRIHERKEAARLEHREAIEEYTALLERDPATLIDDERSIAEKLKRVGIETAADGASFHKMFYRLRDAVSFTAQDLAAKLGDSESTQSQLDFLARMSQSLNSVSTPVDPLGLNPLYSRPLIVDNERYLIPCPAAIYESLLSSFHFDLYGDPQYKVQYDTTRAEWLETQALDAFRQLFKDGQVHWSLKYGPKKQRAELDGLVRFDNKLILLECKWKGLTLGARQGDVEAATVDISKSIGVAFSQALRARDFLRSASGPVTLTASDGTEVTIDPSEIKDIYAVSLLGRGGLSMLAANLPSLAPLGMFADNEYPWALSILDLNVVCSMMEYQSQLFDYIERRESMMRDPRFGTMDELDMLGVYLSGHLNPNNPQFSDANLVVLSNFNTGVEQYLQSQSNPKVPRVDRPTRTIHPEVRAIISAIESTDQPGRSDFVLTLLSLSDSTLTQLGEKITETREQTKSDHERRHFSIKFREIDAGLTFVCLYGDRRALEVGLMNFSSINKYRSKTTTWIGVGIDEAEPNPPHIFIYFDNKWTYNQEFEDLLNQDEP